MIVAHQLFSLTSSMLIARVLMPGFAGKIVLSSHDSLYLPARSICALFVGLSLPFVVLGVIR
jgi:hypothetical protein